MISTELQHWQGNQTGDCHEWYSNTPKKWFHEAIQKLPRRWQQSITLEGNMLS